MHTNQRSLCRLPLCALASTLVGLPAAAQAPRALDSVFSYQTVKVAEGVYAFITPEERSGFQPGNSIAIIGDSSVLIVDSGNMPSVTRRQIAELRMLTDRPLRYLVNTHWHPDHHLGNGEYRAAEPGITIIGTSATRAGIVERTPVYFGQMKEFAPTDSLLRASLAKGTRRDGTPLTEAQRVSWKIITDDYAAFMPEVLTAKAVPSDLVFDDSLTISLGGRTVQLLRTGRGNTAGDAVVYVPDAKVLITGDLVTVPCPFPGTSFFSEWIAALDRLATFDAAAIVPGHGGVQRDFGYVRQVRELLVFTRQKARDAVRRGLTLEQTMKEIDFAPWVQRFAGDDVVRRAAFNNFYPQPAVQRAWEEAKAASESPIP